MGPHRLWLLGSSQGVLLNMCLGSWLATLKVFLGERGGWRGEREGGGVTDLVLSESSFLYFNCKQSRGGDCLEGSRFDFQ